MLFYKYYNYAKPTKLGRIDLPTITAIYKGKAYKSKALQVNVVDKISVKPNDVKIIWSADKTSYKKEDTIKLSFYEYSKFSQNSKSHSPAKNIALSGKDNEISLSVAETLNNIAGIDGFEKYGVFNLIPHAGSVKLKQVVLDIEDLGGMSQLQESLKQSMLLGESTPEFDQEREALWQNRLAESRMDCLHDGSLAVILQNHQQACESLIDFMGAKKSAIQLKITATKAISLEEVMLAGMMGLSIEMLLAKYDAKVLIE